MTSSLNSRKDFSLYLNSELIKLFGEPFTSSAATVIRFAKKNTAFCVDYVREGDYVDVEGFVMGGGITLQPNDAIAFIEEANRISHRLPNVNTFRITRFGSNLGVFPVINFGVVYSPDQTREKRISTLIKRVGEMISNLEKLEDIIVTYRTKEVGYSEIEQVWQQAKTTGDRNTKGKLLEKLFVGLIQMDGGFMIHECRVRTRSEEIDIVIKPGQEKYVDPFWFRISSPLILLECKNWKDKVGAREIRDFAGKIENRPRLLCRIGFLIAMSGFTSEAEEELVGFRSRDFILATVTGDQVEALIRSKKKISELLQKRLIDAGFR